MTDLFNPVLRGSGRLYDALRKHEIFSAADSSPSGVLVFASDVLMADQIAQARGLAAESGVAWLAVRAQPRHVVIGPVERTGEAGCADCAALRELLAHPHRSEKELLRRTDPARLAAATSSWLTGDAAHLAAALVADDLVSLRLGRQPRSAGAVVRIALEDLDVRRHALLPDPRCSHCGTLAEDTAAAAVVEAVPLPKPREDVYRLRDVRAERRDLLSTYVDDAYGMVRHVARQSSPALALSNAPMGLRDRAVVETGFGRGLDYDGTDLTAVLEAVERHGGMAPGGKRVTVRGSYRDLAADALDPRTLGEHSPEQYDARSFPYQRFDPAKPLHWVWGYSFTDKRPVLVPRAYAYYGLTHAERHAETSVYEISNGCALGGSVVEAALHGLLEVVERDAFLISWYARLSLPEIDPRSSPDPAVGLLAARLAHTSGCAIRLFDATMEHGVPAVWAVAVNPRRDERAATVSAAGAHPQACTAAFNALCELGPMLDSVNQRLPAERSRAERMVRDPDEVRAMADHALMHAHPDARERLDFLLRPGDVRGFDDAFCPPQEVIATHDLTDDLTALVERFARCGLPVVVVDQTTDEHRAAALHCVKTIVPGMLPMTFGHRFRRLTGLPRLWSVPTALERGTGLITTDPHPFP